MSSAMPPSATNAPPMIVKMLRRMPVPPGVTT